MAGSGETASPNDGSERVGTVLGSRYRLVRKLGEGGMGVVYEAEHVRLQQRFAVKLLGRGLATSSFVARFEREARAAAQLASRHVAKVFDVDTAEDGSPFFAMELLQGRDLNAELGLRGRLPWAEAARVVQEACVGMTEAHERGIIHRDLKPANLYLHRQDGGRIVKVLDFGISKSEGDNVSLTQTQQALGTPLYMSPEQIRSPKHVDARTDVWSLGVILYESLTGRPPFFAETVTGIAVSITNDSPPEVNALCEEVPSGLTEIVRCAMSKKAEERFATARELGAALAPFAGPELADVLPNAVADQALASTVSADLAGYGPPPTAALPLVVPASRSRLRLSLGIACFVGIAFAAWALGARGQRATPAVDAGSAATPSTPRAPSAAPAAPAIPTSVPTATGTASASSSAADAESPSAGASGAPPPNASARPAAAATAPKPTRPPPPVPATTGAPAPSHPSTPPAFL